MSNIDLLRKEVESWEINNVEYTDIIKNIANSIPANIPDRMKYAIAMSEIILFISQFRINIQHWNESIIPINSLMFIIARSGASKDSSLRNARRCFNEAYVKIEANRVNNAINKAIKSAIQSGISETDAIKFENYKKYYTIPSPLFSAISTPEGFIQHINDLQEESIGAGYTYEGEFASALQSDANLLGIIKIVSQCYDMGNLEAKMLKDRSMQSKEIKSMPISILMQTSHDGILYDESVKRKFRIEFTGKLARRSFFIFANEKIQEKNYANIDQMLEEEKQNEDLSLNSKTLANDNIIGVCNKLLQERPKTISVSDAVRDMFIIYKKYNEHVAEEISHIFPISKLTRQHMQWKALKLSGALAILGDHTEIVPYDYLMAMKFSESIYGDIELFEKELMKDSYEMFVDYIHDYEVNGEISMNVHHMKKLGFINGKGTIDNQLKELAKMANSYDYKGIYTVENNEIKYSEIKHVDKILVSYLFCEGTKEERAKKCEAGYKCEEIKFESLISLLKNDYAYSPFKFENGIRGKDNIISGCKWIVLDVDDSEITDEECHLLLEDIKHIIVRTSNPDNAQKYRVIIELDTEIHVKNNNWIQFTRLISKDLGIKSDPLSKAQIFFSYKGRNPLYNFEGNCLQTKQYLEKLSIKEERQEITPRVGSSMLANPIDTFRGAYEAKDKEGARKLIWAAKYARELGADLKYAQNLVQEISDYWIKPFPQNRMDTLLRQLERWDWPSQ